MCTYLLFSVFAQYKPPSLYRNIPYGQGLLMNNGFCTIMASVPCIPLPYFSDPQKSWAGEKMGYENHYDNTKWIRENRYILENVGNEAEQCPTYIRKKLGLSNNIIPIKYDATEWWSSGWIECLTKEPFFTSLCKFKTNFPQYILL